MTNTHRLLRTRTRRLRTTSLPTSIYHLPDGRIIYLRYHTNPVTGCARPYIAADDGHSCPAYLPPLPQQIWQKHPVLNPARIRQAAAVQLELAKLLKLTGSTAELRLTELITWLAVMYRLADTAVPESGQHPAGHQTAL